MTKENSEDMSFLEHLEELRWHLIRSMIAIIVFAVLAFLFHNFIFDSIIIAPKSPDFFTNRMLCALGKIVHVDALCINSHPFQLININMSGQFTTHIMVSIFAGFIIAFPYIFYEFWRFLAPALYSNERKYTSGAVFFSSLLFLLGVVFGYFIITPLSVHFLGSYTVSEQVTNQINLTSYISTVASVVLASGIIFELPMLVLFLSKIGLITPAFLKKYRRHAFIVILVVSAVITPPDIFSQILVTLPLVGLYEVSIGISARIVRKQKLKDEQEEEETDDVDKFGI
ncbi:MAG TPA: twin-arginine translocase subunit TatC [Bacteroidales bacterium]|nr:twin-arginine translocase subunit TatC [Bacteroidales bacterium]